MRIVAIFILLLASLASFSQKRTITLGRVGLNYYTPYGAFDTVLTSTIRLTAGAGNGKVWTSDASGWGSWQVPSSTSTAAEYIAFITSSSYTVSVANGLVQNILNDYGAGAVTLTLPTPGGTAVNGMVIYLSNLTSNNVNYSQPVYSNMATTFNNQCDPGAREKLIYSSATGKWHAIHINP